jgi:hypothetical protein
MHALKIRSRFVPPAIHPEPATASRLPQTFSSEIAIPALQILSIGLLSGLCCFTGSLLLIAVM